MQVRLLLEAPRELEKEQEPQAQLGHQRWARSLRQERWKVVEYSVLG